MRSATCRESGFPWREEGYFWWLKKKKKKTSPGDFRGDALHVVAHVLGLVVEECNRKDFQVSGEGKLKSSIGTLSVYPPHFLFFHTEKAARAIQDTYCGCIRNHGD
jgi:hypothetical protein